MASGCAGAGGRLHPGPRGPGGFVRTSGQRSAPVRSPRLYRGPLHRDAANGSPEKAQPEGSTGGPGRVLPPAAGPWGSSGHAGARPRLHPSPPSRRPPTWREGTPSGLWQGHLEPSALQRTVRTLATPAQHLHLPRPNAGSQDAGSQTPGQQGSRATGLT